MAGLTREDRLKLIALLGSWTPNGWWQSWLLAALLAAMRKRVD